MTQVKALSVKMQKIATEELGEVPSRVHDDLEALKAWIQQQSHLKARTDDQFLVQFLRGCQFDLAEAKKKVEHFYAFKTMFPYLTVTDRSKFREIHNLGCVAVLPTPLNNCGPRIAVHRYNYSPDKYRLEEIAEVCNAMIELCIMNDPYACICGVVYIFDMANVTLGHILQYTPTLMKKLVAFYEKSLPLRIERVCFINVPLVAEQFFKVFLTYLSDSLRQRVFICGKNMTKLTEQIPLKYLPEDYGGGNGCLEKLVEDYNRVWDENEEYFRCIAEYGIDRPLDSGGPFDFDGLFSSGTLGWIKTSLFNRSV